MLNLKLLCTTTTTTKFVVHSQGKNIAYLKHFYVHPFTLLWGKPKKNLAKDLV